MAYDNTNTGTLWKHDKGDNEKRPDFKGSIDIEGVEYKLSSWVRISVKGEKFHSIKAERKEQAPLAAQMNAQARQAQQASRFSPDDDDIGF